jgi:hypothetical protein
MVRPWIFYLGKERGSEQFKRKQEHSRDADLSERTHGALIVTASSGFSTGAPEASRNPGTATSLQLP